MRIGLQSREPIRTSEWSRPRQTRPKRSVDGLLSLLDRHHVINAERPQHDRLPRLRRVSPQQVELTMEAVPGIRKTSHNPSIPQTDPHSCRFINSLKFLVHQQGESAPCPAPQGLDRIDFSRHIGPFVFGQQQVPSRGGLAPRLEDLIEPRASRRGQFCEGLHAASIGSCPPASSSWPTLACELDSAVESSAVRLLRPSPA